MLIIKQYLILSTLSIFLKFYLLQITMKLTYLLYIIFFKCKIIQIEAVVVTSYKLVEHVLLHSHWDFLASPCYYVYLFIVYSIG